MKKIGLFFLVLLLVACGGNSVKPNENLVFSGVEVNVALQQKCNKDEYPNEQQLSNIFEQSIKNELRKKNKFTEKVEAHVLKVDVDYHRVFMGEFFGSCKAYGSSEIGYKGEIVKGGQPLYMYQPKGKFVPSQGVLGNFAKIGKQLSLTSGTKTELKDINVFTKGFVKDLNKYDAVLTTQ